MIDDLTNAWYDSDQTGQLRLGEDWGARSGEPNSAIAFLENNLLNKFPHAAITFFTVMGEINSFSPNYSFTNADAFDANEPFKGYFRGLIKRHKIEIVYHGYNHGYVDSEGNFVQEWKGFTDLESAYGQIRKGQEIYKNVFGFSAQGGKYGGYEYNNFADQSIDESKFLWWCRNWTPRAMSKQAHKSTYEPKFFGKNMVVDMPSTLHGRKWTKKQIEILLANQQIITIQEHIAKYRPHECDIQRPNIIDDINDLLELYKYLQKRKVWHATLTEIASYFVARSCSKIYDITKYGFTVKYFGKFDYPNLTIKIIYPLCFSKSRDITLVLPNNIEIKPEKTIIRSDFVDHIINIPIITGRYRILF